MGDDVEMADDGWRLGYRPGLDQLRGMAVTAVVVAHALPGTPFAYAGNVGVTVFFVLSGFLITRLLIEERSTTGTISVRAFYVRRARRLLPALPLAFALCALGNAATGRPILRPLVAAATYTLNYTVRDEDAGAFVHMWSLAVEEHFYLLWPLAFLALPFARAPTLLGLGITVTFFARIVTAGEYEHALHWTHYRTDGLLIGCLLALLAAKVRSPSSWHVAMSVGVLLAFATSAGAARALAFWGSTFAACAAAAVVLASTTWAAGHRWLERLGQISYGVYLFHLPVVLMLHDRVGQRWWVLPVTAALAVGLAELSMRTIEAPLRGKKPAVHDQLSGMKSAGAITVSPTRHVVPDTPVYQNLQAPPS